jgi:hypothetical protein
MNLADILAGMSVFVDANVFLFALTNHPVHGMACQVLIEPRTRKSWQWPLPPCWEKWCIA